MSRAKDEDRSLLLRFAIPTIFWACKGVLYFLSLLGPVLLIAHFRALPVPVLLILAILGFPVGGFIFLSLLVLTKKILVGSLDSTGRTNLYREDGMRWFRAFTTTLIVSDCLFRTMINGLSLLAVYYYRGMGAKMPWSVALGPRARISDPWFVEMGENVLIGTEAVILGHLGYGSEVVLGRVVIGDRAVVGMRAVVFPDVRIGSDARVGAGSIVIRGTVIPDGETWAGAPARKISRAKGPARDRVSVELGLEEVPSARLE